MFSWTFVRWSVVATETKVMHEVALKIFTQLPFWFQVDLNKMVEGVQCKDVTEINVYFYMHDLQSWLMINFY